MDRPLLWSEGWGYSRSILRGIPYRRILPHVFPTHWIRYPNTLPPKYPILLDNPPPRRNMGPKDTLPPTVVRMIYAFENSTFRELRWGRYKLTWAPHLKNLTASSPSPPNLLWITFHPSSSQYARKGSAADSGSML